MSAGHVFHFQAAERGKVHDEQVEQRERVGQRDVAALGPRIELKLVKEPPGVSREAVADDGRDDADSQHQRAHAAGPLRIVNHLQDFLFQILQQHAPGKFFWKQFNVNQNLREGSQLRRLLAAGFIGHPSDNAAEHAQGVLEPLGVAPQPIQVVGDPAGQFARGPRNTDRLPGGRE